MGDSTSVSHSALAWVCHTGKVCQTPIAWVALSLQLPHGASGDKLPLVMAVASDCSPAARLADIIEYNCAWLHLRISTASDVYCAAHAVSRNKRVGCRCRCLTDDRQDALVPWRIVRRCLKARCQ